MISALKSTPEQISFETERFGALTVAPEKVIHFVKGIPGFERQKRYILIDHDSQGLFKWLQAVDDPALAFLLVDPAVYMPGYAVPLREAELGSIGARDKNGLLILVMVTVNRTERQISLNLKGPLLFNSVSMKAVQHIIDRDDYPASYAIKI